MSVHLQAERASARRGSKSNEAPRGVSEVELAVCIKAGLGSAEAFVRALGNHEYSTDQHHCSTPLRTYTQEPYPCAYNVTWDEQVRYYRVLQEHPSPDIESVVSVV